MKVVIYTRVSTRERDDGKNQDTENQAVQLRGFCARRGWDLVREYTDRASGKNADRPAMTEMFEAARRGEFDCVLVWALDRLTREGVLQTFEYIRQLADDGVKFESLTEPHFSTTGPAGELMLAVAAWIAKQERARISERTIAGIERAKRQGKTLGRPRTILDGEMILTYRKAGFTLAMIAQTLGASISVVHRACKKAEQGKPTKPKTA